MFSSFVVVSAALVPRDIFNELLPRQTIADLVGSHISALLMKQTLNPKSVHARLRPFPNNLRCEFLFLNLYKRIPLKTDKLLGLCWRLKLHMHNYVSQRPSTLCGLWCYFKPNNQRYFCCS
jgi:hypothetical protein